MDTSFQNPVLNRSWLALHRREPSALKVLVVEDDKTQWPLWESILKSCSRDVEIDWETTQSGAECLLRHAFQMNRHYSLVISDIFLEGEGNGVDLWTHYGEAADNFIFVSGLSLSKVDAMINMHFGTPLYLKKPLSPSVCKEMIKSLCFKGDGYE